MTFTYNTTLPNPPDDPADDVSGMQVNTLSISQLIDVDHVGFNVPKGGMHEQVTFAINQASPVFAPGVSNLCATLADGESWPFWRNNAAGGPFQIFGRASLVTNGYSLLARGLILQWGKVINPNSTTGSVNFPTPFTSTVFGVFMTLARNASGNDGIWINTSGTNDTSQFAWRSSTSLSNASDFFYWYAVGK